MTEEPGRCYKKPPRVIGRHFPECPPFSSPKGACVRSSMRQGCCSSLAGVKHGRNRDGSMFRA